ncbi:MAG: hypothetical protein CL943_01045 [Candidatus Diapherotrites archaeon]|uniref:Uncharacterized protein n=1 Tax=Candidatus Iainarchaeum sp. TaxID=3101447 RepID=A0A2D6M0C8_9ARCH|nr:hypothetical protein [Candidatus Diapherotrites archaeon]|tara:strand:- start:6851 stop:7216 length:366 start_codon:yes stop_codon:yes gene_type:complete
MFFDFVNAVINLDFGWFVWLVSANIFWLFAFIALCFFFWDGKTNKTIAGLFLLSVVAWTWIDFELMSGWILFVGGFLSVYYITKVAILTFAENTPSLQNKLIIVSEIRFLALLLIYNLFMR